MVFLQLLLFKAMNTIVKFPFSSKIFNIRFLSNQIFLIIQTYEKIK